MKLFKFQMKLLPFVFATILGFESLASAQHCSQIFQDRAETEYFSTSRPKIPTPRKIDLKEVARLSSEAPLGYKKVVDFLTRLILKSRISFPDFRKSLNQSTLKFVSKNKEIVENGRFVAVHFGYKNKSNFWTLQLIREQAASLGLPKDIHTFGRLRQARKHLIKTNIKDILIVDDAAYGGVQISHEIESYARNLSELGITFHIVIPYLTAQAKEEILSLSETYKIKLYTNSQLESFYDQVMEAFSRGELGIGTLHQIDHFFGGEKGRASLVYFDHKIPDMLSSVSNKIGHRNTEYPNEGSILVETYFPSEKTGKLEPYRFLEPFTPPYKDP